MRDGIRAQILVPDPGALSSSSVPPSRVARSARRGLRLVGVEPPIGAELDGRLVVIGTRRDHRQIAELLSLIRPMYRELKTRSEASAVPKP